MNRAKLKSYAPQARRDFIQAVTDRAAVYGLTKDGIEAITEQGDVAIIGGKAFPRSVVDKRSQLEERIERHGFEQTMEALAYTWFNRLVAIRYMELHGYLDHGYRVLSHPDPTKGTPEIVEHAEHVDLPGLDKKKVIDLKLDGTKEAELYRMLLIAQCNALHTAMPFLFERIDDETELLLPDNLLHSDSIIRKLANEIDEADWQEVEIIGWLYQFYISEKKDEVIGKVVKSEDIPAATQLFTPNWIVKYLVQNSLGRQWLATYPNSPLRSKMEYYIEPAEQTPEVHAQLKAITPESLNPEELTLMDPACGSGHILVEAYDLLKEVYLERGYRLRDIPRLILTKNLFGLEIDDRAAQLAAFALMMKARADDRRIFDGGVQLNVMAIQESNGLNVNAIAQAFTEKRVTDESFRSDDEFGLMTGVRAPLFASENLPAPPADEKVASDMKALFTLFQDAKTYGSLITIPDGMQKRLPDIGAAARMASTSEDLTIRQAASIANVFISQALALTGQHDAVVTNPPYMGTRYFNERLRRFVIEHYEDAKAELYACFLRRSISLAEPHGFVAMITIPNWMFLSSFAELRETVLRDQTIESLIHNGRGVFGSDFGTATFVLRNAACRLFRGTFRRLFEKQGSVAANEELQRRFCTTHSFLLTQADFEKLPAKVMAYWTSEAERTCFVDSKRLSDVAEPRQGLATSDDNTFVRLWHEVPIDKCGFSAASHHEAKESGKKWFPFNKGGPYRRWFGNQTHVVDWEDDGRRLIDYATQLYRSPTRTIKNIPYYFRPGITWSSISISYASFRLFDKGFIIGHRGPGVFAESESLPTILAYLNSCVATQFLNTLSATVAFETGQIQNLPFRSAGTKAVAIANQLVEIHRDDWDSFETSWSFQRAPLLDEGRQCLTLEVSYAEWATHRNAIIARVTGLEEENNRLFIECFGLQQQLSPVAAEEQISIAHPDRTGDLRTLLSYALGCAMGRYSLDRSGLIYAHSGNEGFDPSQYRTFPADADGIVPLTEIDWFLDDAARRFEEFIGVAWPKEHVEENLKFVAESLDPKKGEQPRDTIRRYFADQFFKDHLKTYKRRPIYWLFTSGKLGAFQCLVYLHRYNEGTLARMRTEYVIPLQGKVNARIDQLEGDKGKATSTAHSRRIEKEQEMLRKHQAELLKFDEKLRHYADLRIKLDLDDGVKVNYGKFGDLLAEVKAVCGKSEED